jgi:flagellin-like hook-associated protein FlgL
LKYLVLLFLFLSLSADDNYSLRIAHGKVTNSDFGEVLFLDVKSYPEDLKVTSLDAGYLLKKDAFDLPLDFYVKSGLSYFDEAGLQDDIYEATLYVKVYWNIDFLSNRENSDRIMQFQVGANMDQNERVYIGTMTAQALGLQGEQGGNEMISISTPDAANMAIGRLDTALTQVSRQRADLGAYQNRFEMASKGVAIAAENLTAAESRIRDVDMAGEMVDYMKNQILTQSATAMLAQANTKTQSILQLL